MAEQHNAAELVPSKALNLADEVGYSPGSIVSRAIVQKPVGSMTLFAFDAGQSIAEHVTPFDALVQALDGEGELIIGGQSVPVRAGEAVMMPAKVPHAVHAKGRFKMLLTLIRG
jgi:quercetin dioxygenase-like cupin family protein